MGITKDRALNSGRRLYTCDGPACDQKEPWGKGWVWYGSIREAEDDPESVTTFCSAQCVDDYRALQAINGQKTLPEMKVVRK